MFASRIFVDENLLAEHCWERSEEFSEKRSIQLANNCFLK